MNKILDSVIPHVGVKLNLSPLAHFFRDLLFTYLLWQIGFRGFRAALTTMLISGFFETGNGISFQSNGRRGYFDFLDFLPSAFAGFLVVGYLSGRFDPRLLLDLLLIFFVTVAVLLLVNKLLGREIFFES